MDKLTIEVGNTGAPFVRVASSPRRSVGWTLAGVAVLAALYAMLYQPAFLWRFAGYALFGMLLETGVVWLASGRFRLFHGGGALTAALLACSVPPQMPVAAMGMALTLAIVGIRAPASDSSIRFNRMLVGRLFLMLAFNDAIVGWPAAGGAGTPAGADALATATPLELFHTEEAAYSLAALLRGHIGGEWEGLYRIVPGSPGEMFAPVILAIWLLLVRLRVLEWRTGVSFLLAFCATHAVTGQPVLFNLLSGSVVFAAVFIAGDPGSTPRSKAGRWMGGALAGVLDAAIRTYTFYSEGIVFSFLALNLAAPALDRLAFAVRGRMLDRRLRRFRSAKTVSAPTHP